MRKSYIYAIVAMVIILVAVVMGIVLFQKENKEIKPRENTIIKNETIHQENEVVNNTVDIDAKIEEKVSPKAALILEKHYQECNHTIRQYLTVPEELVNKTQEKIEKQYPDWEVKQFTTSEIILEKQEEGVCRQHYVLKEKEGKIAIYKINQKGEEILKEETDISTEYLPESDLLEIQQGIKVYGDEKLNSILEDFE